MTKNKAKIISTCIFLIIFAAVFIYEGTGGEYADADGYVHFLDVGQGDCTLIETSDGKFGLIDASTQNASYKILSYLETIGADELEFMVLTHPHEDHIGGADDIIDAVKVKTVYMNDKVETTACYERLIRALKKSKKANGTKVIYPKNGDIFHLGKTDFTILSNGSNYDDINDSSICLKMKYNDTAFIFTGDAGITVEKEILDKGYDVSADVLKCGHHGSSTSNGNEFYDAVNPEIAIISCGLDNDYGHPHREVVSMLNNRNINYRRTDYDGDIIVAFDEDSVNFLDSHSQFESFQDLLSRLNIQPFPVFRLT